MTTIPIIEAPSPHEDNAQAIRLELQRLVGGVRGLTLLTPEGRRRINIQGHVDDDFLRNMALLIDAHPDIAVSSGITGAEIRDHLNYFGAYQGVGEELGLHGRKVDDSLLAERGSIGERTLSALKVARGISSPSARAAVVPHLEAIDREFARGRRRRAPRRKADAPAPAPSTPPVVQPPEVKP